KTKDLATKVRSSHGVRKMWTDLVAYSRGGAKFNDPAARDTVVALDRQPNVKWTFHIPESDRVYKNQADVLRFLGQVTKLGRSSSAGQVEMLLVPGTHRDHTRYPGVRWAAEKYAFSR